MVDRLVAVDDADYRLPEPVLGALADTFAANNPTIVHVREHISGAGDQTAAVQSLLAGLSDGDSLVFDRGTWRIDGTLTTSNENLTITLEAGAVIDRTSGSAFASLIVASGDGFVLNGPGKIISAPGWDGTNSAWTYAVVFCTGSSPRILDVTLENVPRVGIGFSATSGTSVVDGVTIVGNFPAGSWTGVETVNFGITHKPGVSSARMRVTNSTIKSCVQGIFIGSGVATGSIIQGNDFEGCHNHGIYNAGNSDYMTIDGNSFVDCAEPIVMTGEGHIVSNNNMIATGTGGNLHRVCRINMRNAVGCIVTGNRMKGDLYTGGAPAIDFFHTGGGTTIQDNICTNNEVIVTGSNKAPGIRMGTGATTTWRNNIIQGNILNGCGVSGGAVIALAAAAGTPGVGGKVLDNIMIVKAPSHGVFADVMLNPDIRGNRVSFEWDATAISVVGGVALSATTVGARVRDNDVECTSAWGTNMTIRAVYEFSGTVGNEYGPNRASFDTTKLTAGVQYFIQSTSGSRLNDSGPGEPAYGVAPGSMWRRTDGGASTTLYIKETAAVSAVWRAV